MVTTTATDVVNNDQASTLCDEVAWDIYSCWKEQLTGRFGGGTPAPSIPNSQRQYDGDNFEDY